jgi:hypothetical protein
MRLGLILQHARTVICSAGQHQQQQQQGRKAIRSLTPNSSYFLSSLASNSGARGSYLFYPIQPQQEVRAPFTFAQIISPSDALTIKCNALQNICCALSVFIL